MSTIELMLEALKWANGALIHIDTPTIKDRIAEAIALGEQELAREPDGGAWIMTQQEIIEQLRKELNELRERVAVLEQRTVPLIKYGTPDPYAPPFKITCGSHGQL